MNLWKTPSSSIKREGKLKAQGDITSLPLDFLIKNKQTNEQTVHGKGMKKKRFLHTIE